MSDAARNTLDRIERTISMAHAQLDLIREHAPHPWQIESAQWNLEEVRRTLDEVRIDMRLVSPGAFVPSLAIGARRLTDEPPKR